MCKGWEYPLPLYVQSFIRKRARGLITCCVVRLWPRVKSNAGSPDVERCKHVKSQATTVYFKLGTLRRVSTCVQHVWGIIGHVTADAGNTVGTDGAPPQYGNIQYCICDRGKDDKHKLRGICQYLQWLLFVVPLYNTRPSLNFLTPCPILMAFFSGVNHAL